MTDGEKQEMKPETPPGFLFPLSRLTWEIPTAYYTILQYIIIYHPKTQYFIEKHPTIV
jgi:hypothetical protein